MTRHQRNVRRHHREGHKSDRSGWLRAAVLGSNDAIVSTSSLMMGVAASEASNTSVLVAGVAGLVAGAMSMAVGEFVSVSSQRDSEQADVEREKSELETTPEAELKELAGIYIHRGLDPELAMRVATELTAHDDLAAHLRDELGIDPGRLSRPLQASWVSATSFATFALIPILALVLAPAAWRLYSIPAASLIGLAALGAFGAHLGGAPQLRAALRVTIGGAIAMAVTAGIGRALGIATG